jgi:uncharacterized protein (TIGR00369 family)
MKVSPEASTLPEFPHCYVCGAENSHGLRIPFTAKGNGVEAEFRAESWHAGYEDIVHGGIISALLDEAIIWAVYVSVGHFGVTAELNVRFLKPLTVNACCTVIGRVTKNKGRLLLAESQILNREGQRIAHAGGKVILKNVKSEYC